MITLETILKIVVLITSIAGTLDVFVVKNTFNVPVIKFLHHYGLIATMIVCIVALLERM